MNSLFDSDDLFLSVSKKLNSPVDYFDFPSSLIAFGQSLINSFLWEYKSVFFRKRNKIITLISWMCSNEDLINVLDDLQKKKCIIKTLNFANKDLNLLTYKKDIIEFWVGKEYNVEYLLSKQKSKNRSNLKKLYTFGENNCTIKFPEKVEVFSIFNSWVNWAKERHFMVFKGHYIAYINNYFENKNNVVVLGYYFENKLIGYCGFEVYKNKAQITLMKHIHVDKFNMFSSYLWIKSLEYILINYPVDKIFCGSTANDLKRKLHFNESISYKIII